MSQQLKGIAIIGMAGRFPGAKNIDRFWQNLRDGVESISDFTDEELLACGVDPALLKEPNYVKAGFVLEDIEKFDAQFFDCSPREAEIMDPQHRIFLECAWEALENAGYDPKTDNNLTGVYAGASMSDYLLNNLSSHRQLVKSLNWQIGMGNEQEFLPTRVSYKLNLKGPSLSVGTACSTSLVAVHLAYRALLSYECDLALAGGITVQVPHREGYLYEPGGILSPDGKTRAFDANAQGGPYGNGVGIVVLKRLADAVADRDRIYAVIKGSAINNDGATKVSYTAPSVAGQAEVIASAQAIAGFEPESVTYIETHGSGTALGDPIEIRALEKVFRARTQKSSFCAIGSVKTNVSHLDTAAGVAGLIKTVLALANQEIPPSLHFDRPNQEIDFANSPFYVNTKLSEWHSNGTPRRAGVSSFGIGGTNVHLALEESEGRAKSEERKHQLLVLSAKTSSALEVATENLIAHLQQHPDLNLADVAYTLQVGRHAFNHRRVVVCQDLPDAIAALQDPKRVLTGNQETKERPIAFMFSGLGTQYVNMGRELYQFEPTFQAEFDRCCTFLNPLLGIDLKKVIYPPNSEPETKDKQTGIDLRQMLGRSLEPPDAASEKLNQTYLTQPAIFVIEYALAKLWQSWGIEPIAAIGYSIGEYVAATLAGVLSLEDALTLVGKRAQMIQDLPAGAMLGVPLSEEEVRGWLKPESSPHPALSGTPLPSLGEGTGVRANPTLSVAAINGASMCVVAGTTEAVEELASRLTAEGIACRQLQTSHAFHSDMMTAIAPAFTELVKTVKLYPPQIPYISNVTGTWITPEQATDPHYWTKHLCQTVRFADGLQELERKLSPILLEVGTGQTLSSLALQSLSGDRTILPSLPYSYERRSDLAFILNSLGQLWLAGVKIDWAKFHSHNVCYRVALPTYPFERQRYWIEAKSEVRSQESGVNNDSLEIWQSLVLAGQNRAKEGLAGFDEQTYEEKREQLDRLCLAYINLCFRRLGTFNEADDRYTCEQLCQQCQIIPRYWELIDRWLNILVEQGDLKQNRELFADLSTVATETISELVDRVKIAYEDTSQQIELLQLYGENLPAILTGKQEPLELHVSTLVKEGEFSIQNLPSNNYYNSILRECLASVVKALLPEKRLRILEVGAGTGTATAELLPILPAEQTEYTFTDVGSFFLNAAKKKFSNYPFVSYRLLDIETPLSAQGYEEQSFDVIVAFKVLHVARNITEILDRVRSLLVPGGLLLLWETTQATLEAEVIDALIMKPIEDETGKRNMGNPFLSAEKWQESLKDCGFVKVAAFSEFKPFREHVIAAQAGKEILQALEPKIAVYSSHARPNLKNEYVAPTNDIERRITEIFQELLGIETVGIHDSFFALGGDSLTGTVLVSQLRKCFEVELPVRALFEAPSVAELALVIEEMLIEELEGLPEEEVDLEIQQVR
ncbi:MAG: acyltransferase domain-containing protein [Cyanosarcina radialis HA8281-LM2]|jgi:acyl transferase domain-containing protein/acyl carrier protein|nr:acyltransferase domain-containing protein [Cyanosarcina radialis HA8281-LM2]